MSTTTVYRRLARASAIAAGALVTTLALASPAFAEDTIETNLGGVSSSATAGRTGDAVSVTFTNKSSKAITSIQPVFTIHLDGMPADGVRIGRALGSELPAEASADGTVRFTDPNTFELLRNGRRVVAYQLLFTSTAPSGRATVTVEAYSGATRLGGDSASVNVKGTAPRVSASPSVSPSNTDPGLQPTFGAGPSYSVAPLDPEASQPAATVPVSLYVMGGLLVGVGGVILWLLFRRQKQPAGVAAYPTASYPSSYPTAEFDQPRPTSLGYPRHASPLNPTAVLPTVDPPTQPGLAPPVDPYSGPVQPPPTLPRRPRHGA